MSIDFYVPGQAVPWARAGGHGKTRFTPKKQGSFMGVLKLYAQRAMAGAMPLDGPLAMQVQAVYAWPASWSRKRREAPAMAWKTSRPDADNLYKIVADALNGVVYGDDAQIARVAISKTYGAHPGLHVSVTPL